MLAILIVGVFPLFAPFSPDSLLIVGTPSVRLPVWGEVPLAALVYLVPAKPLDNHAT